MLRYECDDCRRLKQKNEDWILGFAAENIGARAARREITFLPKWEEARAVEWLAVHFCSDPCKHHYMTRLFGHTPAAGVVTEVAVLPETKRRMRAIPGVKMITGARTERPVPITSHQSTSRKRKNA